jgi:hypothetical protein
LLDVVVCEAAFLRKGGGAVSSRAYTLDKVNSLCGRFKRTLFVDGVE